MSGSNRYETALEIAEKVLDDDDDDNERTIILTTGLNFPDALSAGGLRRDGNFSADRLLIVLTEGDPLRDDVDSFIEDEGVDSVLIVGGTAAVPQSVQDEIDAIGADTYRISGSNRWETGVEIADFLSDGTDIDETTSVRSSWPTDCRSLTRVSERISGPDCYAHGRRHRRDGAGRG